jgi:hypothetical protein
MDFLRSILSKKRADLDCNRLLSSIGYAKKKFNPGTLNQGL